MIPFGNIHNFHDDAVTKIRRSGAEGRSRFLPVRQQKNGRPSVGRRLPFLVLFFGIRGRHFCPRMLQMAVSMRWVTSVRVAESYFRPRSEMSTGLPMEMSTW